MYKVLGYHLPHDLKRRLTYFSWSPSPYDDLRDTVHKLYGIKRAYTPTSNTTAFGSLPSRMPSAPPPLQTVPMPSTTGRTNNEDQSSAQIDPSFKRCTTPEFTDPASDVPVLPTKTLPLLSVADWTSAAAPCAIGFAAETWSAALSAPGDSTTSAAPADLPADYACPGTCGNPATPLALWA
ncbi:hypothetical protein HPB51_015793 [Rhipicephalus microplus]|uniref:Uncharacterized protein n=1 Tax=Rhipicephalus microplus TaxID=6941 RepID=A0A9J6EH44_RHIMP|nr:hypothetical protein HPB51_015793 [Rhipicephalus microplus]